MTTLLSRRNGKITPEQVERMKLRYESDVLAGYLSPTELAQQFGVSLSALEDNLKRIGVWRKKR